MSVVLPNVIFFQNDNNNGTIKDKKM